MDKATKQKTIRDFAISEKDVGSAEVQVALLTGRINEVTEHLKTHRKDHSSRRGLIAMVNQRRRLLAYVNRTNREHYQKLIERLSLRH
ncbi:MAG: 30S ribosomal protein S15 [Lentisphaerae bacterium ADurb.BinA184]|nr:MAG: 30S ribosomal protein S15 [Lentisphaerae bacterium ADurb.BinA184]